MLLYQMSDFTNPNAARVIGHKHGIRHIKYRNIVVKYQEYTIHQNGELARIDIEFTPNTVPDVRITVMDTTGQYRVSKQFANFDRIAHEWMQSEIPNIDIDSNADVMMQCFHAVGKNLGEWAGLRIAAPGRYVYENSRITRNCVTLIDVTKNTGQTPNRIVYFEGHTRRLHIPTPHEAQILYTLLGNAMHAKKNTRQATEMHALRRATLNANQKKR